MKIKSVSMLAVAGIFTAISSSASAAVVQTNTSQGTAFTVLTGDLLEASGTTHVNTVTSTSAVITDTDTRFTFSDGTDTGTFIGVPTLSDGGFGAMPTGPKNRAEFVGITGDATITYSFAVPTTIAKIDIYSAWNNTGRDNIAVNIFYATASAPTTYVSLFSASNNAPGYPNLTPIANLSSITENTTGILAANITSLRFTFPGQENGGVGYREIDVTAVPEPGTWVMMVGGLGLLVGMQRIRARKI